jgi:hypothetical protein
LSKYDKLNRRDIPTIGTIGPAAMFRRIFDPADCGELFFLANESGSVDAGSVLAPLESQMGPSS